MTTAPEGRGQQGDRRGAEVMALPGLLLRDRVAIGAPVVGDVRACASIGPAGELVAVWSQIEHLSATMSWTASPGGVNFRDSQAPRPVSARVTVHAPDLISLASLTDVGLANFTAQPLPGRSILRA